MGKIVELNPTPPDPKPPSGGSRRIVAIVINTLLVLGLILIFGASWLTWRSLEDYTVFRVLVPGVVGGLVCIIVASILWSEDRKQQDRRRNR